MAKIIPFNSSGYILTKRKKTHSKGKIIEIHFPYTPKSINNVIPIFTHKIVNKPR